MKKYSFTRFSYRDIEKIHSIFYPLEKRVERDNLKYRYPIFNTNHRTCTPERQQEILHAIEKEYNVITIDDSEKKAGYYLVTVKNKTQYLDWWNQLSEEFGGVLHYNVNERILKFYKRNVCVKENISGSLLHKVLIADKFFTTIEDFDFCRNPNEKKEHERIRRYCRDINTMANEELGINKDLLIKEKDKIMLNIKIFREIIVK